MTTMMNAAVVRTFSEPPRYETTTKVSVGAHIGTGARVGEEKEPISTVDVGASLGAVLTYGHSMTREELNAYLAEAERLAKSLEVVGHIGERPRLHRWA